MLNRPSLRPDPLPETGEAPLVIEVSRGPIVESRHLVDAVASDAGGLVLARWGEVGRPVYPRSAVKPLQALPFLESGAAAFFRVSEKEIALACASHGGEPRHVAAVGAWLARLGARVDDLECGAHAPTYAPAAEALIRAGEAPSALHNNCSGKHTGMIATARHLGEASQGYIDAGHPVQRRIALCIAEMAETELRGAPMAIDGCSIPTIAMPLAALARAMARLGTPKGLAASRAEACGRVAAAMGAHPDMVAGTGRACTAILEAAGGTAIVKTGAEGVYMGALLGKGVGFALKVRDGATRASEVAVMGLLRHLGALDSGQVERLRAYVETPVPNRRGLTVGRVGIAAGP